jgi:hypothetical protein
MHAYDTVTEALNDLKKRGFTTDFNIRFSHIECSSTGQCLSPEAFEIVEYYRFEGDSNPSDESTVYAVAATDGSLKGVLVTAHGAYSDSIDAKLLKKLAMKE